MFKLSKKVAVVTGASRGIGRSMAETYARAGAHVICVSRNEDALNVVADGIKSNGGSASVIAINVSNLEEFQNLIKDTTDTYGSVDILVNNAGITRDTLIVRMSEEDWDTVIDVNLKGVFNGIKAVSKTMIKNDYGRIINITSTSVKEPIKGLGISNTIRGAVANWAKTLSFELGEYGITVNNILPGFTDTARLRSFIKNIAEKKGQSIAEVTQALEDSVPAGRFADPDETAAAVVFLAATQAAYINGINLPVDGGRTQSL